MEFSTLIVILTGIVFLIVTGLILLMGDRALIVIFPYILFFIPLSLLGFFFVKGQNRK
jgi:hypothetical protein